MEVDHDIAREVYIRLTGPTSQKAARAIIGQRVTAARWARIVAAGEAAGFWTMSAQHAGGPALIPAHSFITNAADHGVGR